MSKPLIIPVPYAIGPYGSHQTHSYKRVLQVGGATENAATHDPSNLLLESCRILPPINYRILPDDLPDQGQLIRSARDMQLSLAQSVQTHAQDHSPIGILGGDHTISIGTGLGLSRVWDMSKIGLIWIDAHGDCNTPETSISKSVTGYPLAVNCGLGSDMLTLDYQGNFITQVVHIGLRDLDQPELANLQKLNPLLFPCTDLETQGLSKIITQTLSYLADCSHIWISIDLDVLDPMYFAEGETDVPVPAGMTPRELLAIVQAVSETNKLAVIELVQLNDVGRQTPLITLSSRLLEIGLGLGSFRYGK